MKPLIAGTGKSGKMVARHVLINTGQHRGVSGSISMVKLVTSI